MYSVRLFSVRRSRYMEVFYQRFENALVKLAPLLKRIGYDRLEKPVAAFERGVKGLLFDCQMCGQCALSSTGMSCSMNCPKNLRNGPCGGVRANGHCEVKPEMKCVWVQGWNGAARMDDGLEKIRNVQHAVDHSIKGKSAWLRVVRMTKQVGEFAPKPVKAPVAKPAAPKPAAPASEGKAA
jgi:hypothetical protein